MLDIRLIRENPDVVRQNLLRRGLPAKLAPLDDVITWDQEWRRRLQELQDLRHRRNAIGQDIATHVKEGIVARALKAEAAALPEKVRALEARVDDLRAKIDDGLLRLPNLLHEGVPDGTGPQDNVEVRRWGEPTVPDHPLKPHGEVMEALGLGDFDRARKVAGAGFVYLLGDLVLLDQALLWFALKTLVERGFRPCFPPFMLRRGAYQGVVDLADFENVMYEVAGEDAFLIATSEHPMAAMFQDEILDEDDLPIKLAGIATQFRKEIGAHGVDTKGLFRMHQFNKVEQFVFSKPQESWTIHEELLANAEAIFRALELPHRVVCLCSADTGLVMAKTYDLEAWFPRQNAYREVVSCSNAADYQARRLNIRVGKMGGEKRLVHTLNSTAVATSRALVAILENDQNADGTVTVPKVLRPFLGDKERIGPGA